MGDKVEPRRKWIEDNVKFTLEEATVFWKNESEIMSYTEYSNQEFEKLDDDGQLNIMALFGNGVDIQLMEYLDSPYRTSYQNFYNYLCYKNFDKNNMIFQKMTMDKKENEINASVKQNWSDFENSLIEIFNEIII